MTNLVKETLTCNRWLTEKELIRITKLKESQIKNELIRGDYFTFKFAGRKYYKNKKKAKTKGLGKNANDYLNSRKIIGNLREARTCLAHLAGKSGIEIFNFAVANELIKYNHYFDYCITPKGKEFFKNTFSYAPQKIKLCLDFSERQFHFGGKLGQEILNTLIDNNICKLTKTRKVDIQADIKKFLSQHLSTTKNRL